MLSALDADASGDLVRTPAATSTSMAGPMVMATAGPMAMAPMA
ncbi:hypothetical protein ABZV24_20180 [Streptomyces sp. NPDC005251]